MTSSQIHVNFFSTKELSMSKKKKKQSSSTMTTTSYSTHTTTKPAIRTSDIDSFIGRASIKDEIQNIEEFFYYSRLESFVIRKLEDKVSKNDIVRTWNLITRTPMGLSKTKKLPFSRLNLVKDYIELEHSYNKIGKKTDIPGFIPIFCETNKIETAVEAIETILLLFLRPWHFKVVRYNTGIAMWIEPRIDAIIKKKVSPGNLVTYYQKGQPSAGGRSIYASSYPTTYSSSYFQNESDYFDSLRKTKTEPKKEEKKEEVKTEPVQVPITYPERNKEQSPGSYSGKGFFHDTFRGALDAVRDTANDRLAKALQSFD